MSESATEGWNVTSRSSVEFGLTKPSDILDKTEDIVVENFSKSEDNIQVYGLSYNDHYIGIKISRVVETQNTWSIFTPGGTVISLFKNSHFIHISCL